MKEKLRLALAIVELCDFIPDNNRQNIEMIVEGLGDGYDYSLLHTILEEWNGSDYDSINHKVHREYFKTK